MLIASRARLGVVAGRNPAKAEGYFERALAVARKAGAKYWRFCAATSMAGLSRDQGRLGTTSDLASALPQLLNNANRDAHIEPRLGYDRLLVEEGLRLFQIVERVEIALLQTSRKPEKAVRELATLGPSQQRHSRSASRSQLCRALQSRGVRMAVEQVTVEPAGEFALKGITAQQGTLYAPRDGGWIETMNIARAECHMIKGIDNIGICTTDVAKSVAFYQRLGFCESYRNDRGMMIAAGAVQLFVFATRQSIPPLVGRELGLCSNPPGIDHISLAVADVNALYSTLRAAGVRFDGPPQDQSYGARMVGLMDPDGNNLYLLQKL